MFYFFIVYLSSGWPVSDRKPLLYLYFVFCFVQRNKNKLSARPPLYASALLRRTLRPITAYVCDAQRALLPVASPACPRCRPFGPRLSYPTPKLVPTPLHPTNRVSSLNAILIPPRLRLLLLLLLLQYYYYFRLLLNQPIFQRLLPVRSAST